MPIYEYACAGCGHAFEELIFGDEQPVCPRCSSAQAERMPSVFQTRGAATRAVPPRPLPGAGGACGTCGDPRGPGACAS
jgi:putative FmdB family regulatory protein